MPELVIAHDGTPLAGHLRVPGGKHAFAHSLACAALADTGELDGVPDIIDSRALIDALALVFAEVRHDRVGSRLCFARPRELDRVVLTADLVARSRNLFCLLPALLLRAREVELAEPPQGCQIGARPTDWYGATLAQFGVESRPEGTSTVYSWSSRRPADVVFAYPTMTGTVIALAAAAAVPGRSTIANASVEPSCAEQLGCAAAMGAVVSGELPEVAVVGRAEYPAVGWAVACDRIHATTYLTAGLLSRGEVTVSASGPLRIPRFVDFLHAAGAHVDDRGDRLTAGFPTERGYLLPVVLDAGSEPLYSSDWVAFTALLLATRSRGESVISDDVFLGRFQCLDNLREFGLTNVRTALGERRGRAAVVATIAGQPDLPLSGGDWGACPDIRGSATLVLAGLIADGPARIDDDFHLRRGYEDLPGGLRLLGLNGSANQGLVKR